MKTAVVYYSMHGNVRYVCEKVAAATGADLIELVPKKAYPDKGMKQFIWGGSAVTFKKKPDLEPYTFSASDYELVILATPVWASSFVPPMRTFFEDNDLSGVKIAFITTSAGGDSSKCIEALKTAAKCINPAAVLNLVEPKDQPSDEKEKEIEGFIEAVRALS